MPFGNNSHNIIINTLAATIVLLAACGGDDESPIIQTVEQRIQATCADLCVPVLKSGCSQAPASQAECEDNCRKGQTESCVDELEALLDCAPEYDCDADDNVGITSCEAENDAAIGCP